MADVYSITNGADDGYVYGSVTQSIDITGQSAAFGKGSYANHAWLRFDGIVAGQGTTCTSAILTVRASYTASGTTCNARIFLNDVDDVTSPPTTAEQYQGLAVTDAYTDWSDIGTWTAGSGAITSPDFASVVTEVIARDGWVPGNAIMLLIKDNGSSVNAGRAIASYENTSYTTEPFITLTFEPQQVYPASLDATAALPAVAVVQGDGCHINLTTLQTSLSVSTALAGQSVTLNPGDNLQTAANSNPASTIFHLNAGTYQNQTVALQYPDHEHQSFIGASGAILDGGGTTTHAFGFASSSGQAADHITIRGLIIQNYAPELQKTVIRSYGEAWDWTVEDCEIRDNDNIGVVVGTRWIVRNNNIHHNGTMGYGGSGEDGQLVGNEIAWNNTSHASWGWEAGGGKIVYSDGFLIEDNYVHDNEGPGIWFDGTNTNTTIQGNTVVNNVGPGIFYEINDGPCLIHDNDVDWNGYGATGWNDGSGILIGTSSNVEVCHNRLHWNHDGLGLAFTDRPGWEAANNYVHDNEVWSNHDDARTGMVTNVGGCEPWNIAVWNNIYDNNTYYFGPANCSTPFYGHPYTSTFAEWQAHGQDVNSTVTEIPVATPASLSIDGGFPFPFLRRLTMATNLPNMQNYGGPYTLNGIYQAYHYSNSFVMLAQPLYARLGGSGVGRRWIVKWTGTATASYGGGATKISGSDNRDEVEIDEGCPVGSGESLNLSFSSADYSAVQVIPPGGIDANGRHTYSSPVTTYETLIATEKWLPEFLADISNYETVRFMEWNDTNNSTQHLWAERALDTDEVWTLRGVPYTMQIDLCNRADIRGWFCLPHLATDDYITQFATLLRDNYDCTTNGPPIIEWTNEPTNSGSWENPTKVTFTATASDNHIVKAGHGLIVGDDLMIVAAGTGGAGLSKWVKYWVKAADTDWFTVSTTSGGSEVDITSDTVGTWQYVVLPYGQYRYCVDRGADLSLGSSDAENCRRYYATRVAEIIDLFDAVYTGYPNAFYQMVVTGDETSLPDMLDYPLADPNKNHVSAAAANFYMFSYDYTDTQLGTDTPDLMVQKMLDDKQYALYKHFNEVVKEIKGKGINALYCYEGGHHLYGENFNDSRWGEMFALARWGDFYQHLFANLRWYAHDLNNLPEVILCHYTGSRAHQASSGIWFGIRQTNIEYLSPNSPEWNALVAFNVAQAQPDWSN